MHMRTLLTLAVAAAALFNPTLNASPPGPDVILSGIPSVASYGPVNGIRAYSLGSNTCNIGTQNLEWNNSGSPGLAMNAYRLHDGRLMQIGLSFVKTACCVANGSGCGMTCQSGGTGLRVGCMDVYSAGWNAGQSYLAARSAINAYSGQFSPFNQGSGDAVFKRLQIAEAQMNLANYPGAQFFVEGVYAATGDAQAGNWLNNASYRPATFTNYTLALTGSFHATRPAIYAWQDHGNGLNQPDPTVQIQNVDVPGEGRFIIAAKVRDNGNGTWRYDYAVYNLNSHRSGASFTVPVADHFSVTNIGFNDVNYHSGEIYDNTDWNSVRNAGVVRWSSPQTFAENPNTNALRWATMYNFWFTSNRGPGQVQAKLGLFRPGTPDEIIIVVPGPLPGCTADIVPPGGDGQVNVNDLLLVINQWGPCPKPPTACPADVTADGQVNVNDLLEVINQWGACN